MKFFVLGYFKFLRAALDQEPDDMLAKVLLLIYRPFQYVYVPLELKEKICSNFCDAFLKPSLTKNVKWDLIPYLKTKKDFPFGGIIKHLNKSYNESNNSLFYCILSLEPDDFGECRNVDSFRLIFEIHFILNYDFVEPTKDSIEVLAKLSKNVYRLKMQVAYIEDSDEEEEMLDSEEYLMLTEFLKIMNQSDKVLKWTSYFDRNKEDLDVLEAFTQLCHNLLLVYKDAVRKYL